MAEKIVPPATAEELRAAILARYETLSKRLQQIARYVLDEPNAIALETLAVLAERTGVQPSAIVRFAKTFGFEGATQMQRLFRDGLLSANASLGYGERIREFAKAVDGKRAGTPSQVLAEFVEGNVMALQHLGDTVDKNHLAQAVDLIAHSGLHEGFGIVFVEAGAFERAAIATTDSAAPEVIDHGETGLLVPPRAPDALAAAIASLVEDPERARRMGLEGRRRRLAPLDLLPEGVPVGLEPARLEEQRTLQGPPQEGQGAGPELERDPALAGDVQGMSDEAEAGLGVGK